jgi:hypothetical protein
MGDFFMCKMKPTKNGARHVSPNGDVYYDDTPEGHAAHREDMQATMGSGVGEEGQGEVGAGDPPPPDTKDCSTYTDAMWDTNCSKHFRFSQMKYKPVQTGSLSAAQIACNWQKLCQNILDPIKDAGFPITISSGYRSPSFNASIGGSNTSDHCFACSADIQLLNGDAVENAKKLFKWIGKAGLPYSQVIFEGRWVHIAYNGRSPASVAVLVTRNGKAPYQNGGGRSGSALPPDLAFA